MKQVFRLSVATLALILVGCASSLAQAPAVDPFVAQLTSSASDSFANDISGNGRFVVVVSRGDIATNEPAFNLSPNNSDANREIFIIDYAQRRIFQITNTRHALKDPNGSTIDPNNIQVEIVNYKPVISNDGRWIAFGSNATLSGTALNPGNFNGNTHSAALASDANSEIFLYQLPPFTEVSLSSGTEAPFVNLSNGTFRRLTDTPASIRPRPGGTNVAPVTADDNREPSINDNGSFIAFVSTRDLVPGQNAEVPATPEIFTVNRATGGFSQVTNTQGFFTFNENPTISGAPPPANVIISFISNGNITGNNTDLNSEVHYATFNGASATGITQVTQTTRSSATPIVNVLNPGRRLSRNGNLIAFESTANLATDGAIQSTFAIFVYDIAANRFTQVGPRSTAGTEVQFRFPTFTGDNSTLVFTSALNLNTDGTIATSGGLNPNNRTQIFSTPVPGPGTPVQLTRLTNVPANVQTGRPELQTYVSNTRERIAFTQATTEHGGGNTDRSSEAFYLLARSGAAVSATVAYFTGGSARPVTGPSPTPPAVAGLAPGMLGIATSNVALAPSNQNSTGGSTRRTPQLPIELNGVTMSINGAACGLFFVGNSPSEIIFVVPIGLAANSGTDTYPVVINNNGSVIRSTIRILGPQPDLFSSSNGPGGRAVIFNVTNPMFEIAEPPGGFPVTTGGAATRLRILLTGIRGVTANQVTVRIGTTNLTGSAIIGVGLRETPGFDQIDAQLPSSLASSCNVPVIVSVTVNGQTFTSRPAESAPVTSIGPCP